MIDLKDLQKKLYQNKLDKGFNTTNVEMEFCLIMEELGEAYRAFSRETHENYAEELADVALFLLGLCEITDVNLEEELLKKFEKIKKRQYKTLPNGHMVKIDE